MVSLDELGLKYGTDKASSAHYYTRLYERYFQELKDGDLKLLEIGVQDGPSLKMWEEYFSKAHIYGIDIVELQHLSTDRTTVLRGSQNDESFLSTINREHGPFDIIIDDGSHHNHDMRISFDVLFPLLQPGGLYIIEDLHACYWNETHGTGLPPFTDYIKELVDAVNSSGKSGVANKENDHSDGFFNQKQFGEMTWMEQNIEFLHLYRSICFIKKW